MSDVDPSLPLAPLSNDVFLADALCASYREADGSLTHRTDRLPGVEGENGQACPACRVQARAVLAEAQRIMQKMFRRRFVAHDWQPFAAALEHGRRQYGVGGVAGASTAIKQLFDAYDAWLRGEAP